MFPDLLPEQYLRRSVDQFINQLAENYSDRLTELTSPFLNLLISLENLLKTSPWWLVLLVISLTIWLASKSWKLSLMAPALLFIIGSMGLWQACMQTLALMIVAMLLCVAIGIPVGILISRCKMARKVVLPILDVMQTMPSFVYLIPVVMLFGIGRVPAVIATVVYALPPLIRLTELGIRLVDKNVLEASEAFGASPRQQLLGVQLPLALPNIMAGINQATMMALSMVVIASMIGSKGLGGEVLTAINRLEVGRGLFAGLAIVVLAILFDRTTQALGKRGYQRGFTP